MKPCLLALALLITTACGPTIDSFNKTSADLTHEAIVASEQARCSVRSAPCLSEQDFQRVNVILYRISEAGREYTKVRIAGPVKPADIATYLGVVAEETATLARVFPTGAIGKVLQELIKLQTTAVKLLGGPVTMWTIANAAQLIALLQAAYPLGEDSVDAIKRIIADRMTPTDLQAVLAQWDDNVARSAHNAGLDA